MAVELGDSEENSLAPLSSALKGSIMKFSMSELTLRNVSCRGWYLRYSSCLLVRRLNTFWGWCFVSCRQDNYTSEAAGASKLPGKSQIRPIVCRLFCVCRLCRTQSGPSTSWEGAQHSSCLRWGCQNGSTGNPTLGCSWSVELSHLSQCLLVPSFNNVLQMCVNNWNLNALQKVTVNWG